MHTIDDALTTEALRAWSDLVGQARRVAVTCHLSPDGDAMGSALGVARVLTAMGKDVTVIWPDTPAETLMFLPGARRAVIASRHPDTAARIMAQADLLLCMDFNALQRVGRLDAAVTGSRATKVLIDHHTHPEAWPDLTISAPESSSTCMLLYRLLEASEMLGYVDRVAATCIYTGMMTDTGNFSYNANDPDIYRVIANLLAYGIDKNEIYRRAMGTSSADSIRLCAYALYERMELLPDYHLAIITLNRDELNRFRYQRGDTEGLVNKPLEIPGVKWSVFMRQDDDSRIKVSMRSTGSFGVNTVCTDLYGGGGHHNAAGGDWHGSLDSAVEQLRRALPGYIDAVTEAVRTDLLNDPFHNS